MFNIFNRKKGSSAVYELNKSISKIDRDIYMIQQWISHLHDKSEGIKSSHLEHIELTRRDINNINKWLQYLHAHNSEMHGALKHIIGSMIELKKNFEGMTMKIEKIEQGQARILERTLEGHVADKSLEKKDMEIAEKHVIIAQKEQIVPKHEFSGSQLELLNVLYHADRPLSYEDLSRLLGKKEKSIRNLIYELRGKKVDVLSRPIGIRIKGFYLVKEEKIRVSGR